jgi:aminopeptidase N
MINPNHNDWAYARIALDDRTIAALEEQLSDIPEPLTRSVFLAALRDMAMAGEIPLADYLGHAMRLADNEKNIRILQQISSAIIATVELMQRLRPETDDALADVLPRLEAWSLRHASDATTGDLTRIWFNTFAGIVATKVGLGTVTALLHGTAEIDGLPIAADVRWMLLTILSRNGAGDIDALLAAESASDVSDFATKSLLMARASTPDKSVKTEWLEELRNPEVLIGLARQRAVMAGLFPSNQTALQLEVLNQVLDALPDISDSRDPYFISSYASVLLSPMCVEESSALMQDAIDRHADQLNSTALRFLKEAYQADSECLALRSAQ